MNILEVYKKYQLIPLQVEHHLRVASVADLICENFTDKVDRENVVKASLLHDMGNIIKFDLDNPLFQDSLQPQGVEFWKKVQTEFRHKYGNDEHVAHLKIAGEIGVGERILDIINAMTFHGASDTANKADFGKKICQYADDRVGPWGVVSLEDRFKDLQKRYAHHGEDTPERHNFEKALREIEKQIFARCKLQPEDITDESIKLRLEILKSYDI